MLENHRKKIQEDQFSLLSEFYTEYNLSSKTNCSLEGIAEYN